MKCTNCGAELTGKFCTVCGTKAPEQTPQAEPMQYNPAPEQTPQAEPMQYTPAPEQTSQEEPMQYNPAPEQAPQVEPVQYAQPQQYAPPTQTHDFSQQYQNYSGANPNYQNGYAGQQFTNQPNNAVPQPKKSMSTGKIVALVLGIVGGVFLLLIIIAIVSACSIVNSMGNAFDKGADVFGDIVDKGFDAYDRYNDDSYEYYNDEFNIDDFMSYDNDVSDTESMITCGGEYWFAE